MEMRLWQGILGCLSLVPSLVESRVLFVNEGYCDFELYEVHTESGQRTSLGTLIARGTKRFDGYLGKRFEILRNETVIVKYDVPESEPDGNHGAWVTRIREGLGYGDDRLEAHHFFPIPAQALQTGLCDVPPLVEAADPWVALLCILMALAVVLRSVWRADVVATRAEVCLWYLVMVPHYITGTYMVYKASEEYRRTMHELQGGWNPVHGDRKWGLHSDFPRVSQFFGGRHWDLKDKQMHSLVVGFLPLLAFAVSYVGIKALCNSSVAETAYRRRLFVTFVSALGFAIFLHEAQLLLTLSICMFCYFVVLALAKADSTRRAIPAVTWLIALSALVASADGILSLKVVLGFVGGKSGESLGSTLDGFKGELSWYSVFNLVLLRMVSWGIDFSRFLDAEANSADGKDEAATEAGTTVKSVGDEKARADACRSDAEYHSLVLFISYLFYPPLYIAGPIISFNAFASYMREPQQECRGRNLVKYALRWLFALFLFVTFSHFLYVFAINVNGPLVSFSEDSSPIFDRLFGYGMHGEAIFWYSYWALMGLWFKFLVIWRFARMWALFDGICPPENMRRCMNNNGRVRDFWRNWHASFNRWLVRYIFIPFGGSRGVSFVRRLAGILVVFLFVALWHEPALAWGKHEMHRVAIWALLMFVSMVPELLGDKVCQLKRVRGFLDERPLFARHLSALGSCGCIWMLQLSNLIGYSYGVAGAQYLISTCAQRSMMVYLVAQSVWNFAGAQTQLFVKRMEAIEAASKKTN